jgi:hypothetical protein
MPDHDPLLAAGPYAGAPFALLTMHGKEAIVAPRFAASLGAPITLAGPYDTDRLGTFTREVARAGTQLEAARRKAQIAIELSGLPRGLGSEGSFAAGPFGVGSWNLELVVLVDRERGLEVVGSASRPGHDPHGTFAEWEDLAAFAVEADFPSHGLVLRPGDEEGSPAVKDAGDLDALREAFVTTRNRSTRGEVFVESDRRAHRNPTRQRTIAAACDDLLARLASRCPACDAPGFGLSRRLEGLRCRVCDAPTNDWRAEQWRCVRCPHFEDRPRADLAYADPLHCPFCNP